MAKPKKTNATPVNFMYEGLEDLDHLDVGGRRRTALARPTSATTE
jgi:hypothetical protein